MEVASRASAVGSGTQRVEDPCAKELVLLAVVPGSVRRPSDHRAADDLWHAGIFTSGTDISPGAGPHNGTSALDDMAVRPEPRQLVIPVTADRAFPTVGTVTEKTSPTEPAHEQMARLVSDAMSALATAVAAAAAMVVVLAWISTWQDVHEVSRAQYLFWPLAVAAATLQVMARRIRRSSGHTAGR